MPEVTAKGAATAPVTPANPPAPKQEETATSPAPHTTTEAVKPPPVDASAEAEKKARIATARLAKKERELKAKEEALLAKEQALQPKPLSFKERILKDPAKAFQEEGLSYDEITQLMLSQPGPEATMLRDMQAQIADLKAQLGQTTEKITQKQQSDYEAAINQVRTDVKRLVDSNPELEVMKARGDEAIEAAVELVKTTFEEDGVLIDINDAAKQVEEYLAEEAYKMASLGKIRSRFSPPTPASAPAPQGRQPFSPKTLTHQTTVHTSAPLSARERRERAIAAFKGQQAS